MNRFQINFLTILVFLAMVPLTAAEGVMDCTVVANGEAEAITFTTRTKLGQRVPVDAVLMKPDGKEPFPALVILHGEGGVHPPRCAEGILRLFAAWGYVSLFIDSTSAQRPSRYMGQSVFEDQAQDAHKGKEFLTTLSYIKPDKIGVIGWWVGGAAVIDAVSDNKKTYQMEKKGAFKSAVAIYPLCFEEIKYLESPLHIFIGEKDTRASASSCRNMKVTKKDPVEYLLTVYPNAGHLYDFPWLSGTYDDAATEDTYTKVKNFFDTHLQR